MESKLYVGNLSYNVSEGDLQRLFEGAGTVKEVSLIMDRTTRQSKGFGFVEMATDADAQKAIEMFNGYEVDGRKLIVNVARPREERGGGGGYGGNRGGGGGYGGNRGGGGGNRGGRPRGRY
jgi:RNA recognition motif-containing protein